MKNTFNIVYVTVSSSEEAVRIGRSVLEERLAACVNIIQPVTSIYWWQGKLEVDNEVILLLKTRAHLVNRVISKVQMLHSFSCPCIVALPIVTGSHEFLEWIEHETTTTELS